MQELSQSDDPVIREYFQGPRGRAASEQAAWNIRDHHASTTDQA
jgi:phospholipid/cholesterol/gamma-HCH transport system ATP-binding protein